MGLKSKTFPGMSIIAVMAAAQLGAVLSGCGGGSDDDAPGAGGSSANDASGGAPDDDPNNGDPIAECVDEGQQLYWPAFCERHLTRNNAVSSGCGFLRIETTIGDDAVIVVLDESDGVDFYQWKSAVDETAAPSCRTGELPECDEWVVIEPNNPDEGGTALGDLCHARQTQEGAGGVGGEQSE